MRACDGGRERRVYEVLPLISIYFLDKTIKDGQIDEENTGKLTEMEEREEAKDFEGQLDKL